MLESQRSCPQCTRRHARILSRLICRPCPLCAPASSAGPYSSSEAGLRWPYLLRQSANAANCKIYVAEAGVARTRLITLGDKAKDQVEALSGLNAGEKVIFPVPQ